MGETEANTALLESWVIAMRGAEARHRRSERTVRLYVNEVERFAGWLVDHGHPADLLAVDRQTARAWLADLRHSGLADNTVRSRWIAARAFYKWAVVEDELGVSPLADIVVAKTDSPPPAVMTERDVVALLAACKGTGFYDRRDLALIRLFLATGLRASEMTGLTLEDIDLQNRLLVVRKAKGGGTRIARFDPVTNAAVDRYRRVRGRHRYESMRWLWLGLHGRFTVRGLETMLDKRAKLAGLGHVHPHMLRHTFADRWLSAGGGEGDLQRLGGWKNSDVMARYGEARAVDRALEAYDRITPMGDL